MKKISLNGCWHMTGNGYDCAGMVPGSVYSFLLENHLVDDPYFRDNEDFFLELCDHEYTFSKTVSYHPHGKTVLLHCDGLDTIADVSVNGKRIASTNNMHRIYEFDVTEALIDGINEISVLFYPVDAYMKKAYDTKPARGAWHCMLGYGNVRKAHCMMGWDWGPRLPDAGIWRDIYLLEKDSARLTDVRLEQRHENGRVFLFPQVTADGEADVRVTLTAPDGTSVLLKAGEENEIASPLLWMPNGLGEQPLYTVTVSLLENGNVVDETVRRIGLRTLALVRERDKYGESFCHEVNGVRFFAMGADYIPEDNVLSRVTRAHV